VRTCADDCLCKSDAYVSLATAWTVGRKSKPYPFAVMIDNVPEARPQTGLAAADVIYEAPAEGGIPRMLALFLTSVEAERIGPVRSTRHYFVYLAAEYGVPLVHIGSSPQAQAALDQTRLERLDEARGDSGFVRDRSRPAPHDAFVSTASVRAELARRRVATRATTAGLVYGALQPGAQAASRIRIAYPGGAGYTLQYDYDAASKTYQRSMDGQPHVDAATRRRYAPSSLIVQLVDVRPIPNDEAGRVDVQLIGNGKGLLLAQGTQIPIQWSKGDLSQPTRFRRDDGAPFALPDGQVWIQLVPLEGQVELA
jgi:hypothetical protein